MYWLTGLLGFVLIIAPFLFGYSFDVTAFWTSLAIGAILIVMSLLEGIAEDRDKWEYWVVAIAGVGAVFAPFILGFSAVTVALWTLLIVGVVTIIAAGAKLFPGRPQLR